VLRNVVNEIIPGQLYQRGQILTWQREKKYAILDQYGINRVVNFWPKMDPDLAESRVLNYFQISAAQSEQMLEDRVETVAHCVADLTAESPAALVLCEAGKTRSVYFCILLVSLLKEISLEEAKDYVLSRLRSVSLKGCMLQRISKGW